MKLNGLNHKMKSLVEFKIDSKAEAKNIPLIVGLGGYEILTREAFKMFEGKTKKGLYPEVLKLHKKYNKELSKRKKNLEKDWKRVEKKYFLELEKIIGEKVKSKKTVFITSSLNGSIADVIGRKNCFINYKEKDSIVNYIVMHELTHLYYSDFIVKSKLNEAGKSPLMEAVDHLILFKSPIKKFVQNKYENIGFIYFNHKFMNELEKIWENRKDFESFLKEAIKIQRKYKNIKIC
jgi:hypothetical protein